MEVKPFKFAVQATVLRTDGDRVLGEVVGQVVTLYGVDELAKWAADFEKNLRAEAEPGESA